ncbi:phosphoribosylanthranilate isomerase [Kitasatospora sp. NPDC096147]|uniref:phosphoribosylanthranilate isomerase n=1 Tax=Kitasatospora sp. NPDC096147 TaxID=3364093 RepID=UPI0037F38EB1
MFVKVCGVRNAADVTAAVDAGADAVGFMLTESVRRLDPATARGLAGDLPPGVLSVGVVSGIPAAEAGRLALAAGLNALQLHGRYAREDFAALAALPLVLLRATHLGPVGEEQPDLTTGAYGEAMLLLDSPRYGHGERWDLGRLADARPTGHWLLAGGLTPGNVAEAIGAVRPWGVDVSSGVEAERGVKDPALIRDFVAAAKGA